MSAEYKDSDEKNVAHASGTNQANASEVIDLRLKRKKCGDSIFYTKKCENHRHRVAREVIVQCQRSQGGCRMGSFSRKAQGMSECTQPEDQDGTHPDYPPRLLQLFQRFRSTRQQPP